MSVLSLTDIRVVRAGRSVLTDVALTVNAGETVGVVGISGAGKSTLMRVALGLQRPDAGEVRWGLINPYGTNASSVRRARRHLGAVFQQPAASLDPRSLLGESLAEPLRTHAPTMTRAERQSMVGQALTSVGLPAAYAGRLPAQLSGGEAQRAAIARALILRPAFVVLDEPTSALDASAAAGLLNLIGDLSRAVGTAFLIVSHDLAAVGQVARRLVVLDDGRVVEQGETDACYRMPRSSVLARMLAAIGGRPSEARADRHAQDGAPYTGQ
jgi:peptide/nickel transport system ATP-binding protein